MRSLFTKILLWSFCTLVVALVAFWVISVQVTTRAARRGSFFGRGRAMQLEDARKAYESGGKKALADYLERLETFFPGEHYLTDVNGKDLLDGTDRSALLERSGAPSRFWPSTESTLVMTQNAADGKYHFVIVVQRQTVLWDFVPYYLLILVFVALFCYILAIYLARPLRTLRSAVQQFGRGELSARVNSARQDEIGELSRSFDHMAERIETLLTAERRLLQDISHELRSPLARLSFAVELTRTATDREAAVARIRKEVDRLSSLVGGLLQVTRVEGDPASRNVEELSLDHLLRDLAGDCAIEAQSRKCEVLLDASVPVMLRGDRELLRRAIENVMRNAIRYSPEGKPIEVKLEAREKSAVISIRDYGPGVPEDQLSEIFKPFVRVGRARDTASGGVGLGLAIAHRAVTLHHGTLEAVNVKPGLQVTVELPLDAPPPMVAETAAPVEAQVP